MLFLTELITSSCTEERKSAKDPSKMQSIRDKSVTDDINTVISPADIP